MEEKTPLWHRLCAFRCLEFETTAEVSKSIQIFLREITSSSKTIRYFRGSRFSQCFILYQQLSIARYHLGFYCNNYFEKLPIVSSVLKHILGHTDPEVGQALRDTNSGSILTRNLLERIAFTSVYIFVISLLNSC